MTNKAVVDLKHWLRPILLATVVVIALLGLYHLWQYYTAAPWTRDGRIRVDVVNVASDVSGLVTEVLVQDNQPVQKGQVLFRLDRSRLQMAVQQAQSDLAKAQANLVQAQANVAVAKANILKNHANTQLADKNAQRYAHLLDGAISKQEQDQIFAQRDQSHAEQQQSQAALVQALAAVKQQQALQLVAQSSLDLAQLNAARSSVVAPDNGTLSNFALRVGNYVQTGQAVAALVDRKKMYVVGYFEETKLNKVKIGDAASIQLMGDAERLSGHVQGIASGIEDRERTTSSGLLANVNPTFTWVRLAQRVPVKIIFDQDQSQNLGLIAGRTATIHILQKP
jgi:multidrug resistance efflux pump